MVSPVGSFGLHVPSALGLPMNKYTTATVYTTATAATTTTAVTTTTCVRGAGDVLGPRKAWCSTLVSPACSLGSRDRLTCCDVAGCTLPTTIIAYSVLAEVQKWGVKVLCGCVTSGQGHSQHKGFRVSGTEQRPVSPLHLQRL